MADVDPHSTLERPEFSKPVKVLIVAAPFYRQIVDNLLAGARAELEAAGATHETVEVPGALEIPAAMAIAASRSKFDGFVALGCVIRGETSHYEIVCNESARGLTMLGLEGVCIGNGILTVDTEDQGAVRADPAGVNKGGAAAAAAMHLIALARRWSGESKGVGFATGDVKGAGETGKSGAA